MDAFRNRDRTGMALNNILKKNIITPQESPVLSGYYNTPSAPNTYAKPTATSLRSSPLPLTTPGEREKMLRLQAWLEGEGKQLGIVPPSASAVQSAMNDVMGKAGGYQDDYRPPVSPPTPQMPTPYGTLKTPFAIPKEISPGVYGQESLPKQAARLEPLQQDVNWVAQTQGIEVAKALQAKQIEAAKALQAKQAAQQKNAQDVAMQKLKNTGLVNAAKAKPTPGETAKDVQGMTKTATKYRTDLEQWYSENKQKLQNDKDKAIQKVREAYPYANKEYPEEAKKLADAIRQIETSYQGGLTNIEEAYQESLSQVENYEATIPSQGGDVPSATKTPAGMDKTTQNIYSQIKAVIQGGSISPKVAWSRVGKLTGVDRQSLYNMLQSEYPELKGLSRSK